MNNCARTVICIFAWLALITLSATALGAQANAPQNPPMVLTGAIPLPHVQGRIDHFALGPEGTIIFSALGNNTEEVVDLAAGIRAHSIPGIPRPQGVVYAPQAKKLFVGSDEGKLYIFDGNLFAQLATLDFGDDVDNLRYEASTRRVYVGYGDGDTAAIAMVDAATNQRLPQEFKLGAHPESFQMETSGPNIYVNLPDLNQVAAVNRKTGAITRWHLSEGENFPMALDEKDHRLFVVTRAPARLIVLDTASGRVVAKLPCVQDSDDLYYDSAHERIYAAGGEGYIAVFQQSDPDHYRLLAKVRSELGGRTAGYWGAVGKKGFERLYVAIPARAGRDAELLIYTIQD